MEIITEYEKLSNRCDEIDPCKENKLLREIISKLKKTIEENDLPGLAANQVGYNKRVFCINFGGSAKAYINPMVQSGNGLQLAKEKRAGVEQVYLLPRCKTLTAMYVNPLAKIEKVQLKGPAAVEFQHLNNLLDGVLVDDLGLPIDDDWDELSDEDKGAIVNDFLESLDLRRSKLLEELKNNEESNYILGRIDAMTKVATGEIQVTYDEADKKNNDE